jgi:hypothetical protein
MTRRIDDLIKSCALTKGRRDPSKRWDDPAGAFRLVVVDIFGASMNGPEVSDETARGLGQERQPHPARGGLRGAHGRAHRLGR